MSDLKEHIALADQLKEFEKTYVAPMRKRSDTMLAAMTGTVPDEETRKKYGIENSRTEFLEEFVNRIRKVVGGDAVRHEYIERFLKACDELSVIKDGNVREKLLKAQSEGLTAAINKLKEAVS